MVLQGVCKSITRLAVYFFVYFFFVWLCTLNKRVGVFKTSHAKIDVNKHNARYKLIFDEIYVMNSAAIITVSFYHITFCLLFFCLTYLRVYCKEILILHHLHSNIYYKHSQNGSCSGAFESDCLNLFFFFTYLIHPLRVSIISPLNKAEQAHDVKMTS